MTNISSSFAATNHSVTPTVAQHNTRQSQISPEKTFALPATQLSLSPQPTVSTADASCYDTPKIRLPRDLSNQQRQLDDLDTQDPDEADARLGRVLLAMQKLTVNTAQSLSVELPLLTEHTEQSAVYGHTQTTPLPLSPAQQLFESEANVTLFLRRQPDLQTIATTALQRALQRAFPALQQPINPDRMYVSQYTEDTQSAEIISQTLSQALHRASSDYPATTTYNQSRTGFFYTANNITSANEIPGMKGSQHLLVFEKILEEESTPNTRRRHYQDALNAFWNTKVPALGGHTLTTWLARQYGQQRLAEAQLRVDDGTLTSTDLKWLTYLADPMRATIQPGTFSLSLQDGVNNIAFAGILVLTQRPNEAPDTTSGPVLLIIPGQGLLTFASATAYQEALQQLFDSTTERDILLTHVARDQRQRAADLDNDIEAAVSPFRYQATSDLELTETIQTILQRQTRDLAHVVGPPHTQHAIPDATFNQAASLQATFDLRGVLQKREQLRLQKFLAPASTNDKNAWLKELAQYRSALQKAKTSGLPDMVQYLDPDFLTRYASDHLRDQIKKDLNLEIDPDQVIVTTYELAIAYTSRGDLPSPPNARQSEKVPTRSTLTELALANTRMLDQSWGDEFPVKTVDGNALPQLTRDYLTRIIRAANIGQRYKEFLQSRLLDSAEGKARENAYAQFLKARLLLDTREATIRGDITADSAQWIRASMTANPIKTHEEHVLAHDLNIDGNQLNGILVFATPQPISMSHGMIRATLNAHQGVPKVVLYTPDAPDGKRLREYENRATMNRDFINNPAMRDYLLPRIALGERNAVNRHLENGAVDILIKDRPTAGNFLHAAYRTEVAHIIADADARTTSNDEADRQARWDKINRALDIAGILLPIKLSIPLSLVRAGYALYSANDARMRGNNDEALAEFLNGINLSLGAVSDGVGNMAVNGPRSLYQSRASARSTQHVASAGSATSAMAKKPVATPVGMSAIEIDGQAYFYWNSRNNMVNYRDLFVPDPAHPGQIKAAGHGAPDANNVWKKIMPLRGGGNRQDRSPSPQPGPSSRSINRPSHSAPSLATDSSASSIIKKTVILGRPFLSAKIDGRIHDLVYNLEKNAFRKVQDGYENDDTYYVVNDNAIHALTDLNRTVTDAERTATLRMLGINLTLPLDTNANALAAPIPAVIRSIWIGNQAIPAALVDRLQQNAAVAKLGRTSYQTKLYLSTLDRNVFRINRDLLKAKAPQVEVIQLEASPVYKKFKTEHAGKYFAQYQAALNGNGGIASNYASAADILRYRLMFHTGGLYMDIDNTLLHPPGNYNIATTADGLALDLPKSLRTLGMDTQYCNDIFGTQKDNPTLNAISNESYQRYLDNIDLYTVARPRQSTHSIAQLSAYMKRISHVTGPGVFDHVIKERLPEMDQIRDAIKLSNDRSIDSSAEMLKKIIELTDLRLTLRNINVTGSEHSWAEHR